MKPESDCIDHMEAFGILYGRRKKILSVVHLLYSVG